MLRLNEEISHLASHGTFSQAFLYRFKEVLPFFSYILEDEDSRLTAETYLNDLLSTEDSRALGHLNGNREISVFDATGTQIFNVKRALLNGTRLRIENAGADPGSYTCYGISSLLLFDNPNGLTTKLLKNGLIVESTEEFVMPDDTRQKFLRCKNAKVALLYFIRWAEKEGKLLTLNSEGMFYMFLQHVRYTAYFMVFTLMLRDYGIEDITKRPLKYMSGTRVKSTDYGKVIAHCNLRQVYDYATQLDARLFGTHKGRYVNPKNGNSYKTRFLRTLERLEDVRNS